MQRFADKIHAYKGSIAPLGLLGLFFFSACTAGGDAETDRLNALAYAYHYRNPDSVRSFASKALALADGYPSGRAEAYNNLAFADMARMDYGLARARLDSAADASDNQVELLVADVQHMRLCQRESRNKDFYYYRERAMRRIRRIDEEKDGMDVRMRRRYVYALTEYSIVSSTYYYYVGLPRQSAEAMARINPTGGIQADTAQYAAYLYQIGSGGILSGSTMDVGQRELECLMECYVLAKHAGMAYWQANALQAVSEHLLDRDVGPRLVRDNRAAMVYLNEDGMPDSLMAGYLAQRALDMFKEYGDVYQTAGAYRTLAQCFFALGDYRSSLICLDNALYGDTIVNKAPDLVASIRECLSMVYSAIGDKNGSDINRNAYLDIQEYTRQDRQLEARAEQLERTSAQLNWLIAAILALAAATAALMFAFYRKGRRQVGAACVEDLLKPLKDWEEASKKAADGLDERLEAVSERLSQNRLQLEKGKRRSLDNKAKVFLVGSAITFIDRIINEAVRLKAGKDGGQARSERLEYMAELAGKLGEYNAVLTHWIQLRQGDLDLRIESFRLQDVFALLAKSETSFALKGINLEVEPTDAVVKADKVLTLFMLNTLADNACKFTPQGGKVTVMAEKADGYVEVSVRDTGTGLTADELSGIFERKVSGGHGFGLMNCKGIIDKYRKTSRIFNVCGLFAESVEGRGSRFSFRLPYGMVRCVLALLLTFAWSAGAWAASGAGLLREAGAYADSAYFCNVAGDYARTLSFADSARVCLNRYYKESYPGGNVLMERIGGEAVAAEIQWFLSGVKTDYDIILDIRNECAVAALALHKWDLYEYNNGIYTRLFKERSADRGLESYCTAMQAASVNKMTAVVVLLLMLVAVVFAYYFLYYRHVRYFRLCTDNIRNVNRILLSDVVDEEKSEMIEGIDTSRYPEVLKDVMDKIKTALRQSVECGRSKLQSIEREEDELRKVSYETDRLYVGNSVIDNSLSAFKHETMYYPPRIIRLLRGEDCDVDAVIEVASYYRDLYAILYGQAKRQAEAASFECKPVELNGLLGVEGCVLGDKTLIAYLFEVLENQCGCTFSSLSVSPCDGRYVVVEFANEGMRLTEEQCDGLFSPLVCNIPFMICRQVMREMAELTNLHGCGITVKPSSVGGISVRLTFAKPAYLCVDGKHTGGF